MVKIKQIGKIKHLGVYDDFSWNSTLNPFKQFNLIYGWNGAGKTTLSRLFSSINSGGYDEFPKLEYSIKDSNDTIFTQADNFITPIRVFNTEFVSENVNFQTQSSKTIQVVLGEENKELIDSIKSDEILLKKIKSEIKTKTDTKNNKEINYNKVFTNIAKIIGQGTQGVISRSYRQPQAKSAFARLAEKRLLPDEDLKRLSKSISQEVMPAKNILLLENISKQLVKSVNSAKGLIYQTVESSVITRLKDNPDIANWVETGLKLREEHLSDFCEFCGQSLHESRIIELAAHFNEADKKLKDNIDKVLQEFREIYKMILAIQPVDKMNFYKEFQDEYEIGKSNVETERDNLLVVIQSFAKILEMKKFHTTDIDLSFSEIPLKNNLTSAVDDLNKIISRHNIKTEDFESMRQADSQKIEKHYLSTIFDEAHQLEEEKKKLEKNISDLINGNEGDNTNIGIEGLEKRIKKNKEKVSSSLKAMDILNENIATFLGHDEVQFGINEDETAYQILRHGNFAKNLSEGEQMAVAFTFFIVQLKDENFDVANGIIVIDDPVSSLDSNSQFQAFSFLKNATQDAGQLFLLTHNFEFLKLALYWMKRNKHSYYMIKNKTSTTGKRIAYLDKLDSSLEKFESEYHYLFNIVYKYKNDGTIESAYTMPNIARKLLDSYLMFCVPKNVDTYQRLRELNFDEHKKSAIYKFVNDQSHITGSGFDPALVPETQKCVKYVLELMEATFPEHYKYLVESVSI